jgi:hypothetical protein
MEAGFQIDTHLHNGDPLTRRTVHVPNGQPVVWNPPNDWESSAKDALKALAKQQDWSLENGWDRRSYFGHWPARCWLPVARSAGLRAPTTDRRQRAPIPSPLAASSMRDGFTRRRGGSGGSGAFDRIDQTRHQLAVGILLLRAQNARPVLPPPRHRSLHSLAAYETLPPCGADCHTCRNA